MIAIVVLINIQSRVLILLYIDVPIRLVLDNMRRSFGDVLKSPDFEAVGFRVINGSGKIERFSVGGN